jgi:hypothetical protein
MDRTDRLVCDAFPKGIPLLILYADDHRRPYPGDHGIRYEPLEEFANGSNVASLTES